MPTRLGEFDGKNDEGSITQCWDFVAAFLSCMQGVEVQRVRLEGAGASGQVGLAARPGERAQVGVGAHQARNAVNVFRFFVFSDWQICCFSIYFVILNFIFTSDLNS